MNEMPLSEQSSDNEWLRIKGAKLTKERRSKIAQLHCYPNDDESLVHSKCILCLFNWARSRLVIHLSKQFCARVIHRNSSFPITQKFSGSVSLALLRCSILTSFVDVHFIWLIWFASKKLHFWLIFLYGNFRKASWSPLVTVDVVY